MPKGVVGLKLKYALEKSENKALEKTFTNRFICTFGKQYWLLYCGWHTFSGLVVFKKWDLVTHLV